MKRRVMKAFITTTVAISLFTVSVHATSEVNGEQTAMSEELSAINAESTPIAVASTERNIADEELGTLAELFEPSAAQQLADFFGIAITDGVTHAQLETVTILFLTDAQDLKGIENLMNLEYLFISGGTLSDLQVLERLPHLLGLSITDVTTVDVATIARLETLESLEIRHAELVDIQFLAGMTNLTALNLSDNAISDISVLANLLSLEYLHIPNNQVTDITALASLTQLKVVYMPHNYVMDVSPLQYAENLNMLNIDFNGVLDLRTVPQNVCMSAIAQIVLLPVTHPNVEIGTVDNIVYNRDGSFMPPRAMNNEGVYEEPTFYFNIPELNDHAQYTFNTDNTFEMPLFTQEELQTLANLVFGAQQASYSFDTGNDCYAFSGTVIYLFAPQGEEVVVPPAPPITDPAPTEPLLPTPTELNPPKITRSILPQTGQSAISQVVVGGGISCASAIALIARVRRKEGI